MKWFRYIVLIGLLLAPLTLSAQERLKASKIQARARHMPSLGLPRRADGDIDPVIRYKDGAWEGAESMKDAPHWTERLIGPESPAEPKHLAALLELCKNWAVDRPHVAAEVVYGLCREGWFLAVCKKTRTSLGWQSIAFVIPPEGPAPGKSIYSYSHSVNWLEGRIGYNLFPKLPAHLQEIIEEMTATELLCPIQEFDPGLNEEPEREIDYDWEEDVRESMM